MKSQFWNIYLKWDFYIGRSTLTELKQFRRDTFVLHLGILTGLNPYDLPAYEYWLVFLNLPNLYNRRIISDFLFVYQIVNGVI